MTDHEAFDPDPTTSQPVRHRVVIIGAGFGGLSAAQAMHNAPAEVTVVDRTNHHLFQPLLYQVATGVLSGGEIAPPTRDVLRHQSNTRVLLGDVVDIDLRGRKLVSEFLGRRFEVPLRQPDRGGGLEPVVLWQRRLCSVRTCSLGAAATQLAQQRRNPPARSG